MGKKRILISALISTSMMINPIVGFETLFAEEIDMETSEQRTVLYRLYNAISGEHFYTNNTKEKDYLAKIGWAWEGSGWVSPSQTSNPVYRLYNANSGDHHYTMDSNEMKYLIQIGWTDEGIGWYSGGDIPVYRQYNPNAKAGSHNFTTSQKENDALVGAGWKEEGIAWYAKQEGGPISEKAFIPAGAYSYGHAAFAELLTVNSDGSFKYTMGADDKHPYITVTGQIDNIHYNNQYCVGGIISNVSSKVDKRDTVSSSLSVDAPLTAVSQFQNGDSVVFYAKGTPKQHMESIAYYTSYDAGWVGPIRKDNGVSDHVVIYLPRSQLALQGSR